MDLRKATPHIQLIEALMDSGGPHSELEWAARREIASLRERLEEQQVVALGQESRRWLRMDDDKILALLIEDIMGAELLFDRAQAVATYREYAHALEALKGAEGR